MKEWEPDNVPALKTFIGIETEGKLEKEICNYIILGNCPMQHDTNCEYKTKTSPVKNSLLIQQALNSKTQYTIIAGAEPTLYGIRNLINELRNTGIKVCLETKLYLPLTEEVDLLSVTLNPQTLNENIINACKKTPNHQIKIYQPTENITKAIQTRKMTQTDPENIYLIEPKTTTDILMFCKEYGFKHSTERSRPTHCKPWKY